MRHIGTFDLEVPNPSRPLTGTERLMLALIGTVVEDLRSDDPLRKTQVRNYLHRGDASEPLGSWPFAHTSDGPRRPYNESW